MTAKRKLILSIISLILLISIFSCESSSFGYSDIDSERTYLNGRIMQTLDKGSALLSVKISDFKYSVVKIVSDQEIYYDDKKITGNFVFIGTYTYETKGNSIKTVPVYIRESEYKPEYRNLYK